MKKRKCLVAVVVSALAILSGCNDGLDKGQQRIDQIANGETTIPVVAPQTVAQPKNAETTNADEKTSLNFASEEKLLENVTVESFEPQTIVEPIVFEGDEIDLTKMSATIVYAQVLDMLSFPENYIGKKITVGGWFSIYESPVTGTIYYACVIPDATQCCVNGIEFICKDKRTYPDDFPELGEDIRVVGTFETYEEDGLQYCRLKDATMEMAAKN